MQINQSTRSSRILQKRSGPTLQQKLPSRYRIVLTHSTNYPYPKADKYKLHPHILHIEYQFQDPSTDLPSRLFPSRFPVRTVCAQHLYHARCVALESHSPSADKPNNTYIMNTPIYVSTTCIYWSNRLSVSTYR